MKIIDKVIDNEALMIFSIIILTIFLIMIIIFFINFLVDRKKGKYAKFLWFETNKNISEPNKEIVESKKTTSGKNINTGINYGNIGDTNQ